MSNLTFQYPAWFLIFCIMLGLSYALVLYYRDNTFRDYPRALHGLMGGLRFLAVTILSSLLLSPLLKSSLLDTKKPIVVLAQDVSESIDAEMTPEEKSRYRERLQNLSRDLGEAYELVEFSFGSEVRPGIDTAFGDKVTNISSMLRMLYDLYSNQNLGAVVLASDGIYNEGSNPVYASTRLSVPIYTVALGDTTPKRDVIIKRVFHNRIAYLGDRFSVQVDIAAQNSAGSNSRLMVYKIEGDERRQLEQIPVTIDRNDFFQTIEVILDAEASGVQRYRLVIGAVEGEATTANNVKDIFVDVLDARQKILILANAPHPDVTALRQSIITNKNYQVTTAYIEDFQENLPEFDFVILHQLPSRTHDISAILNRLDDLNMSRFFIVGAQTNLGRFNQQQPLVQIIGAGQQTNDVQARVAPSFNLFNVEESVLNELPNFPPLVVPFGEFQPAGDAQPLLYQRIGKVDTRYPLLLLGENNGAKVGVLCGEGIWKWRLFDYLQHENHEIFDDLLGKTVQYLSLKEDKRRFRVNTSENIFNENEPVYFDAELYNESYQLINEPDVSMVITNSEGNEFTYTFNKTNKAYSLNAGTLPVGNYSYRATVVVNGNELVYNGQFSIQPIQLELYETTADHGMLRLLSEKYGGQLLYPDALENIPAMLEEKGTVKPVIYETTKTRSVINLKWIFFLIAGLLSLEWFLRRYLGGY
jgi:hypothetical protein